MRRPPIRLFSLSFFLGSAVVGGFALTYGPAPAEAQTVECFVRVCTVHPNGDRICSEKKIDCPTPVRPSTEG